MERIGGAELREEMLRMMSCMLRVLLSLRSEGNYYEGWIGRMKGLGCRAFEFIYFLFLALG